MITVKIIDRVYQIPEGYHELTVLQLEKITNANEPLGQLRVFIPDRSLEAVTELDSVYEIAFNYLTELPVVSNPPKQVTLNGITKDFYTDVSRVKVMSVFQMDRMLDTEMTLCEQLKLGTAIIVQQLFEPEQDDTTAKGLTEYTEQMTVLDTYNILQWYITELPKLYEHHETPKISPEERRANTKQLERYGMWGTLFSLANNDLQKLAYLYHRPIGEVVMAQGYTTAQNEYQKRLSEILRNK